MRIGLVTGKVPAMLAGALAALTLSACAQTMDGREAPPAAAMPAQAGPASSAPPSGPDYADAANWLCLPGRTDSQADACAAADLDTAVIAADGSVSVERFQRAADPMIDCFYVYPTVSLDEGRNSDMTAGPEERSVVAAQFARFGSQCRTFAPLYRQVTLQTLRESRPEEQTDPTARIAEGARAFAYADVKRAWDEYLANHNNGRGVILIGHSQGADMLKRLVAQEIEGRPVADRMVAAYLLGFNVQVPSWQLTGGDFARTPLCTAADQTGCVIAWSAFAQGTPPAERSLFARSYRPGVNIACVNPVSPGSTARMPLESYLPNAPDGSQANDWVEGEAITQRFVKMPGVVSGECVNRDGAQYLLVTRDASGPRMAPSFGALAENPVLGRVWGLHIVDVNVALGDLVELAGTQGAAYQATR